MQITSSNTTSASTALALLQSNRNTQKTASGAATARAAPPPPPPPTRSSGAEAESLFAALAEHDDANGDGQISAEELAASPVGDLLSDAFSSMDADSDGFLTETELVGAENAASTGSGPPSAGPPPSGGPPPGGSPPGAGGADGGSTTDSAAAALDAMLAAMDADGDGTVTASERRAFLEEALAAQGQSAAATSSSAESAVSARAADGTAADPAQLLRNFRAALAELGQGQTAA